MENMSPHFGEVPKRFCLPQIYLEVEMYDKKIVVLYGSQTGQAEAIAESIHEDACFKDYESSLYCLKDEGKLFNISDVNCAIIVCSTTGDGDPPENARKFLRVHNRKTLPPDHLSHLHYTLLGLGDSNYSTFCGGPKKLEKTLKKCGARSFYKSAFADDGTDMEVTVEPWLEGLWAAVEEHLKAVDSGSKPDLQTEDLQQSPVTNGCEINAKIVDDIQSSAVKLNIESQESALVDKLTSLIITEATYNDMPCLKKGSPELSNAALNLPPTFPIFLEIDFDCESALESVSSYQNGAKFGTASGDILQGKIKGSKQLTSDDAVKRALEFELYSEEMFDYKPGDSFGLCCENAKTEVDWLIERLELNQIADSPAKLSVSKNNTKKSAKVPIFIPQPFTIRQALTLCLEIRSVPKKPLLRALVECMTDQTEKRRLEELCSRQGSNEYTEFVREESVSILDILATFKSCKPSFCLLAQHLPRLMPRRYSVACSPYTNPKSLRFIFNVVRFEESASRRFKRNGVCTGFLESIHNQGCHSDTEVQIFPTSGTGFCLPDDLTKPIVMIGPGTGVSPFIGFLEHLQNLKSNDEEMIFGESWLFYGCRHKDRDYLYQSKLEEMSATGILSHLIVAVSREEQSTQKYVQHCLKEHASEMVDLLLDSTTVFYVCGDARNMARDVRNCFLEIIADERKCSSEEAVEKFQVVLNEKRYKEDIWT